MVNKYPTKEMSLDPATVRGMSVPCQSPGCKNTIAKAVLDMRVPYCNEHRCCFTEDDERCQNPRIPNSEFCEQHSNVTSFNSSYIENTIKETSLEVPKDMKMPESLIDLLNKLDLDNNKTYSCRCYEGFKDYVNRMKLDCKDIYKIEFDQGLFITLGLYITEVLIKNPEIINLTKSKTGNTKNREIVFKSLCISCFEYIMK